MTRSITALVATKGSKTGLGLPSMPAYQIYLNVRVSLKEISELAHVCSSVASVGASVSESAARGRDAVSAAANDAINAAGGDLQTLRTDLSRLKETVSAFMAQATAEATRSAREASSNVVGRIGDVAGDIAQRGGAMASTATDQAEERRIGVRGHGAPQSHRCNDRGRDGRHFDRHARAQTIMKFAKVRATQR